MRGARSLFIVVPLALAVSGCFRSSQTYMVYDPNTEETRPARVEVGLNNNISAEIVSGLDEGDQVINATGARLTTGTGPGAGGMRMGGPGGMMMMRGGGS